VKLIAYGVQHGDDKRPPRDLTAGKIGRVAKCPQRQQIQKTVFAYMKRFEYEKVEEIIGRHHDTVPR
jgi:hypothetical protein